MKRFFLGIATLVALTFSVASSALTLEDFTLNPADGVYNDTGAQYVRVTDLTTNQTVPMMELSATGLGTGVDGYAQDYIIGIFDSTTRVELNVLDTSLSVFSSQLTFSGGNATSTTFGTAAIDSTSFGFFIKFYSAGGGLSGEDFYSDGSPDLFSIFHDPQGITSLPALSPEVALGIGGTGAGPAGHALVSVRDVAPVPLPAAAWLFGSALLGLLGLGRRKVAAGASE